MSEQLTGSAGDTCTDGSGIEEFYVRRINWLITVGRSDLIDEIADDCERRRTAPHPAGQAAPEVAGPPPSPVETGTRLAVARLRRSGRPAFR